MPVSTDRAQPFKLVSNSDKKQFLERFDVFLFDCDGVLWSGQHILPNVRETLTMLRYMSKKIVFVTNNSTKSRTMYQKKLGSMGIDAKIDEIFGSAYASAVYISKVIKLPPSKKVYVIGEAGIEEELRAEGVSFCGGTDPSDRRAMQPEDYDRIRPDPEVGAVLCGLDSHINYLKLSKAFQYLRDPSCLFLLTNEDSTYPHSGTFFPGAGACSAPLSLATGRTGKALGKPNPEMYHAKKR